MLLHSLLLRTHIHVLLQINLFVKINILILNNIVGLFLHIITVFYITYAYVYYYTCIVSITQTNYVL